MIFTVPAEDVSALIPMTTFRSSANASMRVVYIGLNTADPILSDVRVRQALGHAMDRDQVIEIIGANGVRADGIGMPGALGFEPSARDFDLDEAARLLDEAGWMMNGDYREKEGQRLSVTFSRGSIMARRDRGPAGHPVPVEESGIEMIVDQIESGRTIRSAQRRGGANTKQIPSHVPKYQGWTAGEGIRTGEIGYITERPKCDQGARGWERHCDPCIRCRVQPLAVSGPAGGAPRGLCGLNAVFFESAIRLPVFVVQSNKAMAELRRGIRSEPQRQPEPPRSHRRWVAPSQPPRQNLSAPPPHFLDAQIPDAPLPAGDSRHVRGCSSSHSPSLV